MKYTEGVHAKNLLRILENENPCDCCPDDRKLNFDRNCQICREFIGLPRYVVSGMKHCPCLNLGGDEAIKRTWIALEEKGYI